MIAFSRRHLLGALGDLALAAHGVDGDERACQFQGIEQQRHGDDLVAFPVDGFLAEHETLAGGLGGDQMQRRTAPAVRAPRGLPVDRHDVGFTVA